MKPLLPALLLACAVAFGACGGGQAAESKTNGEPTPITKVPPADEEDVEDDGKNRGGWRWKGKRDECQFVAKNRCFDDEKSACKHAGCADDCNLSGGGPARVSCPGDDENE